MLGHRSLQAVEKHRMINTGMVLHPCPFDSVPLRPAWRMQRKKYKMIK